MSDHYYTAQPQSQSRPKPADYEYKGHPLYFTTDAGVFSRGEMDGGTDLLLKYLPPLSGRVLDLGCGWGAIGISVKKANPDVDMILTDVNQRAVSLSRENAEKNHVQVRLACGDGFEAIPGMRFQFILTNPPIRAGKQTIYRLFEESLAHLAPGGSLVLVIRRQQGAESAIKYLQTLYAAVSVLKKSGGFWVIKADKAED